MLTRCDRDAGKSSLKSDLMIGLQLLERLEFLYRSEIMYGDGYVKPSKYFVGKGK